MNYQIINEESYKWLQTQPDNSVDSIVTDPPYLINFMGKAWDSEDSVAGSSTFWEEALRVLKPGGHIAVFSHSRTYHRVASAIEDAGFEIRDQLMWVYGSGFPKSHNIGKAYDAKMKTGKSSPKAMREAAMGENYKPTPGAGTPDYGNIGNHFGNGSENYEHNYENEWKGWGTALKPAHEPIVLARKPLSEKTVVDNVIKWGTGGINIDDCRVEAGQERFGGGAKATAIFDKGSNPYEKGSGFVENTEGRFPANFIHDGSDEVLDLFPDTGKVRGRVTDAGIGLSTFGKHDGRKTWQTEDNPEVQMNRTYDGEGSAARFFYCAKVSKKERNIGCDGLEEKRMNTNQDTPGNIVSQNSTHRNNHPTVKPVALMAYLVRLITPKGGTVLDLFNGSGSTGMACKQEGFDYIGLEMNEEYCEISKRRIEAYGKE